MRDNKRTAAVVIGLCSHGLSIVRGLAAGGVTVYGIEKNFDQPGIYTNKCKKIYQLDSFSTDCILKSLKEITNELAHIDKLVVFPSNDNHVKVLAELIGSLPEKCIVSWGACSQSISDLLQKKNIQLQAEKQDLNYPRSFLIQAEHVDGEFKTDFRFPLIIKPNAPLSSFKAEIISTVQELNELIQKYKDETPLLLQEYVDGSDSSIYFCAFIFNKGNELAHLCGRKLLSHPPARGQTVIAETIVDNEVYEFSKRFFADLKLTGPVSLEVKRDSKGKIWVIEPTVGRTDFWSELCIAAGLNLPYIEYNIALEREIILPAETIDIMWYDSSRSPASYPSDVLRYKSLYPKGKKPVFSYFNTDDLKPCFDAFKRLTKRVVKKTLKI